MMRQAPGLLLLLLAGALPVAAAPIDCDALLGAFEVQSGCGFPAAVTPGNVDSDYLRRLQSSIFRDDAAFAAVVDATVCAKRFDAAEGRHLLVTIAIRPNAGDARAFYDVNERVLAQAHDYVFLPWIGDSGRQFTRELAGIRVQELEFIKGRYRASLRTWNGEVRGEKFTAFCDYPTMEELATRLAARLPGGE